MTERSLYWAPRVLGILAILFLMLFSLDCFDFKEGFLKMLTCFFMHNLPSLGVALILVIAWKWELVGGLLFVAASIYMAVFFGSFTGNPASLIVIAPFLLTGVLFLLHHFYILKTKADY